MSDDNVTMLGGYTSLPIPVERVINGLVRDADDFETILVLGLNSEGELISRSNNSEVGEKLEMMEVFKYNILSGAYKNDE